MKAVLALGLLLVTALGSACAGPAQAEEQEVIVNINHSRFVPGRFEFEAGTTVRFVIHNGDPIDHEFILGDGAVQQKHENGSHARHGDIPGEVSIPAGQTRSTTYRFSQPGTLIIGCHLPAHYGYGMRAGVAIAP